MGRKEREAEEEGGEGPAGRRVCVSSSLGRQPQPPPPPCPPPPFSKTGFSALPAKRGLGPAAPIPGAEGRVQAPPLAREGSRDRIRTHVYASSPAPRASSWLPRRPRQVEGWGPSGPAGVWRREPQKGFPAWANVVLASGGERGIGCLRTPPGWLRGRRSGPSCGRGPRAGRRSAQGWTPAAIPGCALECAPRRPAGEEEEGDAESWRTGGRAARRKAVCGHVVRYVQGARAASCSRATSKPGARLSRLPPRSACRWQPPSSSGWTAPGGSARPAASGLQPSPPRPFPVFPRAPRRQTPVTVSDATVCVRSRKGQPPP